MDPEELLRRRIREHPTIFMGLLDMMEVYMLRLAKRGESLKDNEDLLSRIREHPAFHGGPRDENYWLDLLEFVLRRFGKGLDSLADLGASYIEPFPEFWSLDIENSQKVPLAWKVCEVLVGRLSRLEAQSRTVPVEEREVVVLTG